MSKLKIAGVVKESITDGDGIRFVLLFRGVRITVMAVIILRPMILTEEQL